MDAHDLPKAELHLHVDGLLSPDILRQLPASEENLLIASRLEKVSPVKGYTDWVDRYTPVVYPLVSDKGEFLLQVLGCHLRTLKRQHVMYAEVMLSSFTFQHQDIDRQIALYQEYRDAADGIGGDELQIEFLIAIGRTNDRSKMEKRLQRICGLRIGGLSAESRWRDWRRRTRLDHIRTSSASSGKPDWGSKSTRENGKGRSSYGRRLNMDTRSE